MNSYPDQKTGACPVCGESNFSEVLNVADSLYFPRRIVSCANCGMLFVNPVPSREDLEKLYNQELGILGRTTWDRKKKEYVRVTALDAAPAAPGKTPQESRASYRASYLAKLLPPPASLLDAGCKAGDFLLAADRLGYSCRGLEISKQYASHASRKTGCDVFSGTLEELAAEDPGARFDIITLWDVIEHLPDPAATLNSMNSLQETGGLVSVSTPNLRNYRYLAYREKWTGFREGPEHLLFFSPRTLSLLLRKCGYSPVKVSTYQIPPLLLKWLNVFRLGHSLEIVAKKVSAPEH